MTTLKTMRFWSAIASSITSILRRPQFFIFNLSRLKSPPWLRSRDEPQQATDMIGAK